MNLRGSGREMVRGIGNGGAFEWSEMLGRDESSMWNGSDMICMAVLLDSHVLRPSMRLYPIQGFTYTLKSLRQFSAPQCTLYLPLSNDPVISLIVQPLPMKSLTDHIHILQLFFLFLPLLPLTSPSAPASTPHPPASSPKPSSAHRRICPRTDPSIRIRPWRDRLRGSRGLCIF